MSAWKWIGFSFAMAAGYILVAVFVAHVSMGLAKTTRNKPSGDDNLAAALWPLFVLSCVLAGVLYFPYKWFSQIGERLGRWIRGRL